MMANKEKKAISMFPTQTMMVMAVLGAILTGASFEIINVWPKPISVVPYYDFWGGAMWGLCVGAITGLVLGYLTDETHFEDNA
ncbi:MAG: hypothetical protein R3D26_23340 [Cyanobacteriota/Melainabacteria group bacterium]